MCAGSVARRRIAAAARSPSIRSWPSSLNSSGRWDRRSIRLTETQCASEEVAAVTPQVWGKLRFRPHPALRLLELRTNAVAIWKAIDNDDSACEPESFAEPVTWAVWRKQHSPFFRSLDAAEAWALKAMISQTTFGNICAGLCEWVAEAEAAARAAGMLRDWVDGWIVELLITD